MGFCSKGRRAVRRPACLIQASVLPAIPGVGKAGPPGAGPGKSGRRRRGLGWGEKREEEEPRGRNQAEKPRKSWRRRRREWAGRGTERREKRGGDGEGVEPGRSQGRSRGRGGAGGGAMKGSGGGADQGAEPGERPPKAAAAAAAVARSPPAGLAAGVLPQPPLPEARALAAPADEDAPREPPPLGSRGRGAAEPLARPGRRRLPQRPGPAWSSSKPRTTTSCSRTNARCGAAAATAASISDRVRLAARGRPGRAGGEEGARPGPLCRGLRIWRLLRPWRAGRGGLERGRAVCHYFLRGGSAAVAPAPLRGTKDWRPSSLRARFRVAICSAARERGRESSRPQSGSGRRPPESSSEVRLALKASSSQEWPLPVLRDKFWVRIPISGQRRSRQFSGTSCRSFSACGHLCVSGGPLSLKA